MDEADNWMEDSDGDRVVVIVDLPGTVTRAVRESAQSAGAMKAADGS